MDDVNRLLLRLVEACEEDTGRTPERITIEPNGKTEVNARVRYREEDHPVVYFQSRAE